MKALIVYSSKTGNTRKLAYAVHLALDDADLCRVELAPIPPATIWSIWVSGLKVVRWMKKPGPT